MAQDSREGLSGMLPDMSLAFMSDSDLLVLAERELSGKVNPELLSCLDRSNLVMMVLRNRESKGQPHRVSGGPAASSSAAGSALKAQTSDTSRDSPAAKSSGSSALWNASFGRERRTGTSPKNKSTFAGQDIWCTIVRGQLHNKACKQEPPGKMQPPIAEADKEHSGSKLDGKAQLAGAQTAQGTECQDGDVPEATKTLECDGARHSAVDAADSKHSTVEVRKLQSSTSAPKPVQARGTCESKATSGSTRKRDLKAYMTPEPIEKALARKCNIIKTSSSVAGPSLKAVNAEATMKQDPAAHWPKGPSGLQRLGQFPQRDEESAKTVKSSKTDGPRRGVGRPRTCTSAAAIPRERQKGRHQGKVLARATREDSHDDRQASSSIAPPVGSSEEKQMSKPKHLLACQIDPAEMSNSSVCRVLGNLRVTDTSLSSGKPILEVLPGDLLLAAAGAHPRWELDASLSAWLKERLRPSREQLPETWALKPHQEEGVHWLLSRSASRLGCILADDMGLGKTRQAIAWLLGVRSSLEASSKNSLPVDTGHPIDQAVRLPEPPTNVKMEPSLGHAQWGPFSLPAACGTRGCGQPGCLPATWKRALVLAPSMLVRGEDSVWIKELREVIDTWKVHMRVWQWHGERAGELRSVAYTAQWSGPLVELYDVVIISYESFLLNHEEFCNESWTCVVLDEAQCIKNHGAQIAAATKKLVHVPFRLALTGSPIENSLEDFHSILEFVQLDCAGTVQDFRQRFPPTPEGQARLRRLSQLLVLRRESSVAVNMVPREEVEVAVQMTDVQRCLSEKLTEQDDISMFKRLRDLELLCTHPWCYAQRASAGMQTAIPERFRGSASEQSIADSGKLQELFSILQGLMRQGEKVLIFFCRVITSELVAALIQKDFGIEPGIIRGDTSSAEREKRIREFKADPDSGSSYSQVLLLSVKIGALGLNLPEARWVVHIERVWNPALERQATSRVHRITSRLPVKAYCLFTEDSVEERKRAVLLHKRGLSSGIFEVLDGDQEEEDDAVLGSTEVRELIIGVTKLTTDLEEDNANAIVEEGEGEDIESDNECSNWDDKSTFYPIQEKLKPSKLKELKPGKYGNPTDQQLWQWYAVEGRREIHPRALLCSTAGLLQAKSCQRYNSNWYQASRLSSRPCRLHDPTAREDWQVTLEIEGEQCRLFIPESQRHHFQEDSGQLRLRSPGDGAAPFPIFMPSSGRSAAHPEAGLLDLTKTMVGADGKPLHYVQIVAVKPSEVEKYRSSAPFFTVMELPNSHVVEHPCYGKLRPDDLGVGCSRHWLVLLADALGVDHIVMLDDSVRLWYGTTLVGDAHSPFGKTPGRKAQFTRMALGQVLQYFTPAHFPPEEFQKFSVIGFARHCQDMYRCKIPYKRAHVFSAFLLNVKKTFREQHLNFREELYVWEDAEFTQRVENVCKSFRFAMVKSTFKAGGCTGYVARSENPIIRELNLEGKLSASEIAAEALAESSHGISAKAVGRQPVPLRRGVKQRYARFRRKADAAAVDNHKQDAAEVVGGPSAAELAERTQFELENDPALQQEGAVCDANCHLLRSYYKRFVQAFKDKEKSRADPAAPKRDIKRLGIRPEEDLPTGLKSWDDTSSGSKTKKSKESWGAGWVANHPYKQGTGTVGKAVWFNIRIWGSWRLAFFLARLQRQVWEARCTPAAEVSAPTAVSDAGAASSATPVKSGKRQRASPRSSDDAGPSERKRTRNKDPQTTIFNFFQCPRTPVKVEPASQPTILNFFGKPTVAAEASSDDVAASITDSQLPV